MKSKALIPLVIGLAVGLVAIKLGIDVVKRAQGAHARGDAVVVVAGRTIPLALEITEPMLQTVRTGKEMVPSGAFASVKDVVGRVTRVEIPREVPVLRSMLAPPGSSPGMPSRIPDGYRAVSVQVDEASQVSGFIKPGCRVDVAAVMTVKAGRQSETVSKVILQNVEVAAVGQSLKGEDTGANVSRSVTLLVRPQDVSKLHLAASKGKIRLAMRNQQDEASGVSRVTTEEEILAGESSRGRGSSLLGGLLFGLARGVASARQGHAPAPADLAEARGPWMVELCLGAEFKPFLFKSTESMERLSTGALGGADLIDRGRGQPGGTVWPAASGSPSGGGGWTTGGAEAGGTGGEGSSADVDSGNRAQDETEGDSTVMEE